jgi:hypothetical protein
MTFRNVFILSTFLFAPAFAHEGPIPQGIPRLDHVFVIVMENHGFDQIINNPSAPFINQFAQKANLATQYFAVGHPSLINYLAIVGGSNFGVQYDNHPDWHNSECKPNLESGIPSTLFSTDPVCPIAGTGQDTATPALDFTQMPPLLNTDTPAINVDGTLGFPQATTVSGKSIADQLTENGLSWKSYQESLPLEGANSVDYSDGFYTQGQDASLFLAQLDPAAGELTRLYAVKHNPFMYFKSVQEGLSPDHSPKNVAGFETLYADLRAGALPNFAFIAPNQCNDQHGQANAEASCRPDESNDGTQSGLNPGLIYRGDVNLQKIITAIHQSPVWQQGRTAIIVTWDENDYSLAPVTNQVPTIVDTNYGPQGRQSTRLYTHFSLLKTIEAGLGLPCLNHACDATTAVMTDLFMESENLVSTRN